MRENRESFYDLFLCSRRSRCSRFMFLKRSVRWNFHRETRENREQKRSVLRKTAPFVAVAWSVSSAEE